MNKQKELTTKVKTKKRKEIKDLKSEISEKNKKDLDFASFGPAQDKSVRNDT